MAKSGLDKINDAASGVTTGRVQIEKANKSASLDLDDLLSSVAPASPKEEKAPAPQIIVKAPEVEKKPEAPAKVEEKSKVTKIIDPYTEMVAAFRDFIAKHPMIANLKLTIIEQKPGDYLIYQGQPSIVWAWLRRDRGCRFERTSLLRVILNLDKEHPLYLYFRQYSLRTGGEDASM